PYAVSFCYTASPVLHTLSLHDALPICALLRQPNPRRPHRFRGEQADRRQVGECRARNQRPLERVTRQQDYLAVRVERAAQKREADRKSTRLNSSHQIISYAVFRLKKKR